MLQKVIRNKIGMAAKVMSEFRHMTTSFFHALYTPADDRQSQCNVLVINHSFIIRSKFLIGKKMK